MNKPCRISATALARTAGIAALLLTLGAVSYGALHWNLTGTATSWKQFARTAQHGANAPATSQALNGIHWQTPVDLNPEYSGSDLLIHYGSPLISSYKVVIVPVKYHDSSGADAFEVTGRTQSTGALLWTQTSDYVLPPHGWTPSWNPAMFGDRVYFPGGGGTILYANHASTTGTPTGRLAFYGLSNFNGNPAAYISSVFVDTPITVDGKGDIFFGVYANGSAPNGIVGSIVRIDPSGVATVVSAAVAAGDSTIVKPAYNSAPAISDDGSTIYVAVNDGNSNGYLLGLDTTTLATKYKVRVKDPGTGNDAYIIDDGTASPMAGSDGDVYFGVLENPFGYNHLRGWMLHYNKTLSTIKPPGAFGWDNTASIVKKSMVPSYTGSSPYLVATKYNNYLEGGGDGKDKIAVLDPDHSFTDPISGVQVMQEVETLLGPTPDPRAPGAVKEWCVNSMAVDPATDSILANSEDGNLYRWNLTSNTITQHVTLTSGLGEAYTMTVVGTDGQVFAINNAVLFACGN